MMTLITGFTCPPTIYFKFITKCDKCYYKVRQLFYYKVRQVLQSVTILLQSATGITKCDDYYKVRQYKCGLFINVIIGLRTSIDYCGHTWLDIIRIVVNVLTSIVSGLFMIKPKQVHYFMSNCFSERAYAGFQGHRLGVNARFAPNVWTAAKR